MADRKSEPETGKLGDLLKSTGAGNRAALDEVFGLAYEELRAVADRQLRRERPEHTLQATALVNEAYLKLAGNADVDWRGQTHLVGIAARAMRQVLVDHARPSEPTAGDVRSARPDGLIEQRNGCPPPNDTGRP